MRGINTYLLSFLVFTGVANACVYPRYVNEPGEDLVQRRCQVGCDSGDMMEGTANYQACCMPPPKGSPVPVTCSVIAASKSIATCPHTSLATTDSTGMAAPTDYTPAYATAAATSAPVTSDTAGQSYNSGVPGVAITTWVTETASPDCAATSAAASSVPPVEPTYPSAEPTIPPAEPTYPPAEPTYPPSSPEVAPSVTSSSASPADTCACPADGATSVPAPAETSDTHGEAYSSVPAYNAGSLPGEGDDLSGLDRRLVERTDTQYTCPCPVPVAETSDTNGQSLSSAYSSAALPEPTEDCEEDIPAYNAGSMADGEVTDNEPAAKRFIPVDYSISHPIEKRLYDPPPADFIPEELKKRTEPTEVVTDNATAASTTVTSTTTVTGVCSGAAQSGAYASSAEVSITGGETSTSGGYPVVAATPTTNANGQLTTMWGGGADWPSAASSAATDGANVIAGAASGAINGSSFAVTGAITLPSDQGTAYNAGKAEATDGPIVDNARKRSRPNGEVVVDNERRRRSRWM